MIVCEQCAFLTDVGCWYGLPKITEPNDCPQYEPPPKVDDDLEVAYG